MSTPPRAIPEGMSAVTPHLVCRNATAAIAFYEKAFGAVPLATLPTPDGRLMHGLISINGACVMLVDEFPERKVLGPQSLEGPSPITLHLYVPDVDASLARAEAAGAKITMPADDMFWGDRYGEIVDPFGHKWSIATHMRDLSPEEIASAATTKCGDD